MSVTLRDIVFDRREMTVLLANMVAAFLAADEPPSPSEEAGDERQGHPATPAGAAYIYIRQSTMNQVLHHQESTQRQYALRGRAIALGWPPAMVRILDGDLGTSGPQAADRGDFKALVADVSMGRVGAVFALEASRLARSCADWHWLLELCSLTGTLLIDEDGCYDTSDFNDRLLLGLKGTMSQAELHFLAARMHGGRRHKADRGELHLPLPVGLCYDGRGLIALDPDAQVRGAVELLFRMFRELGSANAVVKHFRREGVLYPRRAHGGARGGELSWGPLGLQRVLDALKNPAYAGIYAYGRDRLVKEVAAGGDVRSRIRHVPREEWPVQIRDHHPGYITPEVYLENLEALGGIGRMPDASRGRHAGGRPCSRGCCSAASAGTA